MQKIGFGGSGNQDIPLKAKSSIKIGIIRIVAITEELTKRKQKVHINLFGLHPYIEQNLQLALFKCKTASSLPKPKAPKPNSKIVKLMRRHLN